MASKAEKIAAGEAEPTKDVTAAATLVRKTVKRTQLLADAALARGEITQEEHDYQMERAHAYTHVEISGDVLEVRVDGPGQKVSYAVVGNLQDQATAEVTPDKLDLDAIELDE